MQREIFDQTHDDFRSSFRAFVAAEIVPHHERWESQGRIDKSMFRAAGDNGFLGMAVPPEYGGLGEPDFRYNAIISEELQRANVISSGMCITLHNDIVLPYLLSTTTDEQRARWLPGMVTGELMGAISMTEPGTGSDLASIATTALLDGDDYVINGSKTFVTNGINADLVIVAAKTDPTQRHRGLSLIVVETGTPGFERGRALRKIGLKSQDTAELFFDNARVPTANLLGEPGTGFATLMRNLAQERIALAVSAIAGSRAVLGWTIDYCRERKAFGQRLTSFQNTKFVLAELTTAAEVAQVYVDHLIRKHVAGELTAEDASKAKLWTTDLQQRVVNSCLQLHGGYGFMEEYPVAKAFLDARVQTIYAGTNEIMKEIIGRSIDTPVPAGN
ncbi:acyl-CoA dehydrogenase [Rhodococcus sp. WS3]|uniref:acyl-CoA dehydrogenase family protein n=1 Tax=Rhodococcus sp. WS3 TaxID=2486271 RepID=UPI001142FA3B|nr:acyl-CoA dehydrogenase family protein [Rhodococcus sp. WS3]ROZ46693.1 acyl-CoA dehydrogenase [Rhodococcus sp. WS3]